MKVSTTASERIEKLHEEWHQHRANVKHDGAETLNVGNGAYVASCNGTAYSPIRGNAIPCRWTVHIDRDGNAVSPLRLSLVGARS